MRFLNEDEVAEALVRFADDPILSRATRTLSSLVIATNANSDGWAYWPKPSRAAARLQELISDNTTRYYQGKSVEASVEQYRKALGPIKSFRTRTGIPFTIYEV